MEQLRKDAKILVCPLASGSSGNSTYIESVHAKILVDAGLSCKTITLRLKHLGIDPRQLDGIIVSHEHVDHIKGIGTLSRRYRIPVYMNRGAYRTVSIKTGVISLIHHIQPSESFWIKDIQVEPFTVPHDAADPLGIILRSSDFKVGITTDLGYPTTLVREKLKDCNILVLESNHNVKMLLEGPYPWPLKQRIMSKSGHLSNDDSVALLKKVLHPDMEYLFLAHLSEQNNRPEIVEELFSSTLRLLNFQHIKMEVALQHQPGSVAIIG